MPTFTRPGAAELRAALRLIAPYRRLARPVFHGLDDIPDERPLLFVGNHTLYGVFDVPLLFAELWERKDIFLRPLGDHGHFKVPLWRDFLTRFGTVDGTRENCARLMQAGETILVFPGGGREVAKRKGERYRLVWKDRLGFVRLAIRHGCTIVPFASVGAEHAWDIVFDADELMATPLGKLLARLRVRTDVIPPVARGLGPTPLPRPERLYFMVAPAIPTREYAGAAEDVARCRELRDRVKLAVETAIARLLEVRENDPDRALLPHRGKRRQPK